MNTLAGLLERWTEASARQASLIAAHPATTRTEWMHHLDNGRAVIASADSDGLRMFLNSPLHAGAEVRLAIPGPEAGAPGLEVRAEVLWCHRNPLPQFGQYTCGLVFAPLGQPGIGALASRCPSA